MDKLELHTRLKIARKDLNLNQIEIAKDLGIQQKSISDIENGKIQNIPNTYIFYFYKKGVSLEWLYDGKGEMLTENTIKTKTQKDNPLQLELLLDKLNEPAIKKEVSTKKVAEIANPETIELYERLVTSKDLNINSLLTFIKSQENSLDFLKDLVYKVMK